MEELSITFFDIEWWGSATFDIDWKFEFIENEYFDRKRSVCT